MRVFFFALVTACPIVLWARDDQPFVSWLADWHSSLVLLVLAPFGLVWSAAQTLPALIEDMKNGFLLHVGALPQWDSRGEDRSKWDEAKHKVMTLWEYEREHHLMALHRASYCAYSFGAVTTLVLTFCTLVLTAPHFWSTDVVPEAYSNKLALSAGTATVTAFLMGFVRILGRMSNGEITSHMYVWSAHTVALVLVADVGLFVMFEQVVGPLMIGLFAGATGEQALRLVIDKATAVFKATPSKSGGPSPLLELAGMTSEHVERLEEEDIRSVQDLAFVPTARLFFTTGFALQQICDWQDRALLVTYVGSSNATALAQSMMMSGAIDLMHCCRTIKGRDGSQDAKRKALCDVLKLSEGGLEQLISTMENDEITMRVRLYWQSVVSDGPANAESAVASRSLVIEAHSFSSERGG